MSYLDRRPGGAGKTAIPQHIAYGTVVDKLIANAIACGYDFTLRKAMFHKHATNSPYCDFSDGRLGVVLDGVYKPINRPEDDPCLNVVSFEDAILAIKSGRYVTSRNGNEISGQIAAPKKTPGTQCYSYVSSGGCTGFAFIRECGDNAYFIECSYVSYSIFERELSFDGIAYLAFEGVCEFPSCFLSPRVLDNDSDDNIEALSNKKILTQAASYESKILLSLPLEVLDIFKIAAADAETSISSLLEEIILHHDNQWQDVYKHLEKYVPKETLDEFYSCLGTFKTPNLSSSFKRLRIDPYRFTTSFTEYAYPAQDGSVVTNSCDLVKFFYDCSSLVYIDSLLSILWKRSLSYSTGGMSTDVLRCLASTTYSMSVLLNGDIGSKDPLEGFNTVALLSGNYDVLPTVQLIGKSKPIDLGVEVTHRLTGRSIIHPVVYPQNGGYIVRRPTVAESPDDWREVEFTLTDGWNCLIKS